jgi:hypothetical protein
MRMVDAAPVRWRDAGTVFWAIALGALALAALAPTRPWGWAGAGHLAQAAIWALFGWMHTPGLPGRARWPLVLAWAILIVAAVRLLGALTSTPG